MSDRTDHLLALLDHLDLRRVTLVGHDWGGAIGLAAALRRPERFGRLVLMNTGAFRPWHIPWRIRVCRAPVLGRLAVQGGNLFCRAALRMTLARKRRLSPEVADGYLATSADWASRRAIYNFVADIPAGPRHPTWDVLADVESNLDRLGELPTLLIWGMKDWCFQPDCLEKFQSIWPRAEVHALSDVGHWVMEDAAEDATEAIAAFLDRTDATRVAEAAARPEDRPMTPQST